MPTDRTAAMVEPSAPSETADTAVPDSQAGEKRFTLRLSPEAVETLDWIAKQRGGVSYAEVIRRALGTERLLLELIAEGSNILVEKKNGRFQEILFR